MVFVAIWRTTLLRVLAMPVTLELCARQRLNVKLQRILVIILVLASISPISQITHVCALTVSTELTATRFNRVTLTLAWMAQLAKTRLYSMLLEPRFKRLRVIVTATTKVSFAEIYRCVPAVLVRITVGALTTAILPVIPAFVHLAIPVPISSAIAKTKATLFSINSQI